MRRMNPLLCVNATWTSAAMFVEDKYDLFFMSEAIFIYFYISSSLLEYENVFKTWNCNKM